jgi:flagellar biosynthesis protein FlhG
MDQAAELRKLALRCLSAVSVDGGPAPRLLVLSGAQGGVGVTTLAMNLAVALARRGQRVVLVDADLYRPDIATLCGLQERGNVADVLTGRREVRDVLQAGPGGIQVLPGAWAPASPADYSETGQRRLLRQLDSLLESADAIVLDAGSGASKVTQRFWQAAAEVVLVATPDAVSLMDAYATLKRVSDRRRARHSLIVNQAADRAAAEDAYRRIECSCRRFLGLGVELLGYLPNDPQVPAAGERSAPIVLSASAAPAAQALEGIAARLANRTAHPVTIGINALSPRAAHKDSAESSQFLNLAAPITTSSLALPGSVKLEQLHKV